MKNSSIARKIKASIDIDTFAFIGTLVGVLLHCLILFSTIFMPTDARAFVGDLRSWGTGGLTQFNVGSGGAEVRGIVQYPNSALIVATNCNAQPQLDWCFTKLNFFGNVDTTWGTANSGSVIEATTAQDFLYGVESASNGGWFAFGGCAHSSCIIKYLANGNRDASFGTNGKKTLGGSTVNDLKLHADGSVVYTSSCYDSGATQSCIGRLLANGNFDASFNNGQERRVAAGAVNAGSIYTMVSMAIDPVTQRIWLTGLCRESTKNEFCVVRLNANGTPDTSYAANGWARFTMQGVNDFAQQILLRPDGSALIVGLCSMSASDGFPISICVTQLVAWTAVIDTTFGDNGKRFLSPIVNGQNLISPKSAFLQQDGALSLFGNCQSTTAVQRGCMMLLSGNGSDDRRLSVGNALLDFAFTNGHQTTQVGSGAIYRDSTGTFTVHAFGSCGAADNSNNRPCLARIEWAYPRGGACTLDLDGDGQLLATTDGAILTRIAAGMRGQAVMNGVTGVGATRGWERVQALLLNDCGMRLAP